MSMHAIDTLKYTEDLVNAGMPEDQARAMARAHDGLFRSLLESKLATKDDLTKHPTKDELREELSRFATKADLASLRTELHQSLRQQTVLMISALGVAVAVMTGFMALFKFLG